MEKQKVLIVDDEPRNQRIISETLESIVKFEIASTGEEALELAKTFEPDLILLDIMMPGISGFELCEALRAQPSLAGVKIIFVSGRTMLEDKLEGYRIGADDYLSKPFSPQELLAKIKVFLRLSAVEKELKDLNKFLEKGIVDKQLELLETHAKLTNAYNLATLGDITTALTAEMHESLNLIESISASMMDASQHAKLNPKVIKNQAQNIIDGVRKISHLIEGVNGFSRDASRDPFELASLKRITEDTLILCREKMKSSGIEIKMHNIPDDYRLKCQPIQISHVLLNLLSNAFDAVQHSKNRWISIDTKKDGKFLEISVTDSGSGIPSDIQPKLFQPFFTTKHTGTSTGLGLSLSKGIVDTHKGNICVDKDSRNTRFVVRLPAAP